MILSHGLLRRYRTSFTVHELLEPGAIYDIRCGLRRVFPPGLRIRLEISSSNFPRSTISPKMVCR